METNQKVLLKAKTLRVKRLESFSWTGGASPLTKEGCNFPKRGISRILRIVTFMVVVIGCSVKIEDFGNRFIVFVLKFSVGNDRGAALAYTCVSRPVHV